MTTYPFFSFANVHPSWEAYLHRALAKMDPNYLADLAKSTTWLPGPANLLNAFSLPIDQVNYVLLGESPYPRSQSANGYAFWDASIHEIWSKTGLSKAVNRATSLRNIIKMLLLAEGLLDEKSLTQKNIAQLNKQGLVYSNIQFFNNFLDHGFLLLNASLVLQNRSPKKDAAAWNPFIHEILDCLLKKHPHVTLILLGLMANNIKTSFPKAPQICAEHPYNLSFITNKTILDFFSPLHLLQEKNESSPSPK